MTGNAKKIEFSNIREGDTIRIVDIHDVVVARKEAHEFEYGPGAIYMKSGQRNGADRTFFLVEREYEQLPTEPGSIVELAMSKARWALVNETQRRQKIWINVQSGARQTVPFMQSRANAEGGFEVIC